MYVQNRIQLEVLVIDVTWTCLIYSVATFVSPPRCCSSALSPKGPVFRLRSAFFYLSLVLAVFLGRAHEVSLMWWPPTGIETCVFRKLPAKSLVLVGKERLLHGRHVWSVNEVQSQKDSFLCLRAGSRTRARCFPFHRILVYCRQRRYLKPLSENIKTPLRLKF